MSLRIILTDDHPFVRSGVHGLIGKDSAINELPVGIQAVMHGRPFVGSDLRRRLEGEETIEVRALSPREAEVLRLFAQGMTVSQVAEHSQRSVKTISRQKSDAMAKLGLRSDLEIYAYAREHGLLGT